MSTIQYVDKERRELLEDLQGIIHLYQPLKDENPWEYRRIVIREIRDYLRWFKKNPIFVEFCELTDQNQDEFMNDILQKAIESV